MKCIELLKKHINDFNVCPDDFKSILMVEVDKTKENVGLFEYNNKQVYIDENSKKYLMHHYDKFKN